MSISWTQKVYAVTFVEVGLPNSTEWWINVTSSLSSPSEATRLSFGEPNGTYSYSVSTKNKTYLAPGGSFLVDGLNASETVRFTPVNYTVTFTEGGLPSETGWWVNVTGGPSTFSTVQFLSFGEVNGTHAYSVLSNNANYTAIGGVLVLKGAAVPKTVMFSPTAFPVTFTESGLPARTSWSVTFRGTTASGPENLVFWTVQNGTYPYAIGSVVGYTASRTTGMVEVHGAAASVPITFAPANLSQKNGTSPPRFLGLPVTEGYSALGGVIFAIARGDHPGRGHGSEARR